MADRGEAGLSVREAGVTLGGDTAALDDKPFPTWTAQDATAALSAVRTTDFAVRKAYFDGDHWQNGHGWVGPHPAVGEEGEQLAWSELEEAFISRNAIKEVCTRHARAIIGKQPIWSMAPRKAMLQTDSLSEEEKRLIAELNMKLTLWWDRMKVRNTMKDAITALMWSDRAPLRLFIPEGFLTKTTVTVGGQERPATVVRADNIDKAFDMIWLDQSAPDRATVYTNSKTKQDIGIYRYERQGIEITELTYRDGDRTVIKVISGEQVVTYVLPFGGRLTMFELRRPGLITPQVIQMQKALNLAMTTLPRAVVTSGFLERLLLNAQMPGDVETDDETGIEKFVPKPYEAGPGVTGFVYGELIEQPDGTKTRATPSAMFREPSPVTPSVEAARAVYQQILEEVDQAHILIAGSELPSGKSREEARKDFESSLEDTSVPADDALAWLLETVLAMAEAISGNAGQYTNNYRIVAKCAVDVGAVSTDEQTTVSQLVKDRLVARETGMQRCGIDDVDAEVIRIREEDRAAPDFQQRRAEVLKAYIDAGFGIALGAEMCGLFDKDEIAKFKEAPTLTAITAMVGLTKRAEALKALTDAGLTVAVAAELAGFDKADVEKIEKSVSNPFNKPVNPFGGFQPGQEGEQQGGQEGSESAAAAD